MTRIALAALAFACALGGCTERTVASRPLDQGAMQVGIMALQWPKVVATGSTFTVKVAIYNAGNQPIPSQAASPQGALRVSATYHWRAGDYRPVIWDGVLTQLPADIAPGAEQRVELSVKSPPSPGKYLLEIDLVQAGAFWFGGAGSQTAAMLVEVR